MVRRLRDQTCPLCLHIANKTEFGLDGKLSDNVRHLIMWEVWVLDHTHGTFSLVFVGRRKRCFRIADKWELIDSNSIAVVFPRVECGTNSLAHLQKDVQQLHLSF